MNNFGSIQVATATLQLEQEIREITIEMESLVLILNFMGLLCGWAAEAVPPVVEVNGAPGANDEEPIGP